LEAAAKLVAGPVGSTWKLTRHKMRATLVYEFARATSGSPPLPMFDVRGLMLDSISGADLRPIENRQSKIKNRVTERIGIEPTSVRRLPDRQQF
jgi:hypothetical protein